MPQLKDMAIGYKIRVSCEYEVIGEEPLSAEEILDRLDRQLADDNRTVDNEFWEGADVVCRKCGLKLDKFDEGQEHKFDTGLCAQCQAYYDRQHPDNII
jgi:ribosomal protein L40E